MNILIVTSARRKIKQSPAWTEFRERHEADGNRVMIVKWGESPVAFPADLIVITEFPEFGDEGNRHQDEFDSTLNQIIMRRRPGGLIIGPHGFVLGV